MRRSKRQQISGWYTAYAPLNDRDTSLQLSEDVDTTLLRLIGDGSLLLPNRRVYSSYDAFYGAQTERGSNLSALPPNARGADATRLASMPAYIDTTVCFNLNSFGRGSSSTDA